jgi:hypothetical protein
VKCGERGQLLNGPSPSAHPCLPIGHLLNGPSPSDHAPPASPLVSYLTVPRPPPTPAPPLVGEPIVEGYNIKTHNFYEIKVDF